MATATGQEVISKIEYGSRGSKVRIEFKGATVDPSPEGNLKGLAAHPAYAMQDVTTKIPEDPDLRITFFVPSNDPEHSGMIISRGDAQPLLVFNGPTERTVTPGVFPNSRKVFPLAPGDKIVVQTKPDKPLFEINVEAYC